jgi:hypothetical protein
MITARQKERLMDAVRTGRVKHAGKFMRDELSTHGLRVCEGWRGVLPTRVKQAIRSDLIHRYGVPADQIDVAPGTDDGSRAAGLARYGDDKSGRAPVMNDRIMIRPVPGMALHMDGVAVHLPRGAVLNIDRDAADSLSTKGVIVVENEEVFYRFDRLNFPIPLCWWKYTVVFRGKAHVARQDTCEAWLRSAGVPVIALPDFDPAGLVLAASVPGLAGILWPGAGKLQQELQRRGRKDLFEIQSDYLDRLNRLPDVFGDVGHIVSKAGRGLNQEAFLL